MSQCEARNIDIDIIDIDIDAFGDILCWVPDAATRQKRRSPVEDDEFMVSLARVSQKPTRSARVPTAALTLARGRA